MMTPDPLYTATYPDGTTVSAGILDGEIAVDGSNIAEVEALRNAVASDLDYAWPEGLVIRMNTLWAIPMTMAEVLDKSATVALVSGTPVPLPEGATEPDLPQTPPGGYTVDMKTRQDPTRVAAMLARSTSTDQRAASASRAQQRFAAAVQARLSAAPPAAPPPAPPDWPDDIHADPALVKSILARERAKQPQ